MKKNIFLTTVTALAISTVQAQIKTGKFEQPAKTKTTPAPAPATNKTSEPAAASVYSLTSVRVTVRTGNDNKEFPSKVYVTLMANSDPANWRNYNQFNLGNEMRVNSDTEFGLNLEGQPLSLQTFQQSGLKLSIKYEPNFFADAWKIESVTLVLEFKDQSGNLHTTLGHKTITFSNAYGFLNNEYHYMECFTDASFAPQTSAIRK
jgi:hypothetical protein